jgi:hypothetical protein
MGPDHKEQADGCQRLPQSLGDNEGIPAGSEHGQTPDLWTVIRVRGIPNPTNDEYGPTDSVGLDLDHEKPGLAKVSTTPGTDLRAWPTGELAPTKRLGECYACFAIVS